LKRVLIISYYWPPAGGISVIRPLKLAKYIGQLGWEPVICTAENPHYPFIDENAINDIPEGLEIIKVPIIEPYEFYKRLTGQNQKSALADVIQNAPKRSFLHNLSVWVRGNFFIPDARCLWIKPVVNELIEYLKDNPVDAIITTGPPHSVNRIGYLLNKKINLPWLADFQDPWTQVDYYKHFKISKWAHRRHRKMENQIFENADLITIVSNSWKTDLEHIGANNVEVVPLGYDPTDFSENIKLDSKFTLTHLGLLGEDRNPTVLIEVIANLCKLDSNFSTYFRLQLVGKVNDRLKNLVKELDLSEHVRFIGQVNRDEALEIMQASQLLLLLLNKAENVGGRIPGKVFEYFGARRPVLSLGPTNTDIEKMLSEAGAGENIDYSDNSQLKIYLQNQLNRFLNEGINSTSNSVKKFTHKEVSATFAKHLETITKK
jgi:glycosyltransferase involved in cell wall biosynthesis